MKHSNPKQLSLDVKLHEKISFDNFVSGNNAELVSTLERHIQGHDPASFYIWGAQGVGVSHLLQASCDFADTHSTPAFYLNFASVKHDSPDKVITPKVLEDLEGYPLVCLDSAEEIAGKSDWEQALFHCYNELHAAKRLLIVGAKATPRGLNIQLPDLLSRLSAGAIYQVQALSDEQKMSALQLRAKQKGLTLSGQVVKYILLHCPRNMGQLFHLLERLDQFSLETKRSITIPVVKQVLASE